MSMTDTTRTSALTLTPIDEMSADNTNERRLIEMTTADDRTGDRPDATNHEIEMSSLEAFDQHYVAEDGARSLSEVDGRRKTRSSQTQSYDIHKGIAASAMDISLLTANANQLRLLLSYNEKSRTFYACIALIISSLVLQICVASGVIIVKSYPRSKQSRRIHQLKVCTSIMVSIVTVINILVASLVITNQ